MVDHAWYCPPGYKAEKWAPVARLDTPMHWRKPRAVLVRDPFRIPAEALDKILAVMALCPKHMFVVLTAHAESARGHLTLIDREPGQDTVRRIVAVWPGNAPIPKDGITFPLPNLQLGVPVSTQAEADERIPHLLATPAAHRFVYVTPREPISFEWSRDCGAGRDHGNWLSGFRHDGVLGWAICERIDRVIVGGGKEPMHPDHVRDIRDQCAGAGTPFYLDGWGDWYPQLSADEASWYPGADLTDDCRYVRIGREYSGRLLDGRTWEEFAPCAE